MPRGIDCLSGVEEKCPTWYYVVDYARDSVRRCAVITESRTLIRTTAFNDSGREGKVGQRRGKGKSDEKVRHNLRIGGSEEVEDIFSPNVVTRTDSKGSSSNLLVTFSLPAVEPSVLCTHARARTHTYL